MSRLSIAWLTAVAAVHCTVASNIVNFTKYSAAEYPNARCLDGSLSGLYIRLATNTAMRQRWLFVLNGGGFCSTEADCISRSKGALGSSDHFAPSVDFDKLAWTSSSKKNPFAEWNLVFVPYCCGSMHTGARTSATNETFGLYFSGHLSIVAGIDYLSKTHGLNTTGSVLVFGGGSAGGIGAFNNYEFVASLLPSVKVLGAPIGGFPPEVSWYTGLGSAVPQDDARTSAFEHHVRLYGAYMNERCVANTPSDEQYTCIVPARVYKHLTVPIFITEALTDSVVLSGFEGVTPKSLILPPVWKYINEYGHNASANFQQVLQNRRDGVFAASCLLHCGFTLDGPLIGGIDAVSALYEWVQAHAFPEESTISGQATFTWIDSCSSGKFWPPCGKKCPSVPDVANDLSSVLSQSQEVTVQV